MPPKSKIIFTDMWCSLRVDPEMNAKILDVSDT